MESTSLSPQTNPTPWRRELLVLYLVALLAGTAVGLYNPVISLRMKEVGFSEALIGAASSLFFLGVIVVAPIASYIARRHSLRAVLAFGLAIAGIGSTLFPMAETLEHWMLFRLVLAAGVGFYLIGGQAAVNTLAPKDLADWTSYRAPTKDYDETVYNVFPYGDGQEQTLAVLHNAAGDLGVSLSFNINQLPALSLVKEEPLAKPE